MVDNHSDLTQEGCGFHLTTFCQQRQEMILSLPSAQRENAWMMKQNASNVSASLPTTTANCIRL